MYILQIEHPVRSYEGWKQAFDADPVNRRQSGVRRHRVLRPCDDPNFIMVQLEFDTLQEAQELLERLGDVWRKVEGRLIDNVKARIVEIAETVSY